MTRSESILAGMRACVFDFDGTLADTEGFHFEIYKKLLKDWYGADLDWPHWLHYIGRTDPDFHRMMEQHYGIRIDSRRVMPVYFETLLREEPSAVRPYPWVRDMLQTAQMQGVCPCVLSSGNRDVILACLKAWDLLPFFEEDNVISVSSGAFTKKDVFADPAKYIKGFSGSPGSVVLFEDSVHTIEKARDCGVGRVCGIKHEYNRGIEEWCDVLIEG